MDSIFKLFNIPTADITEVTRKTGSIIAGSAPLCAFVGGKWEPNDLDIWYYDNYEGDGICDPPMGSYDKLKNTIEMYTELLAKCGYKLCDRPYGKDEEERDDYTALTYKFSDIVKRVYKFYNDDNRKSVQLIITYAHTGTAINSFDLSCCVTWWDPRKSDDPSKMLQTLEPELTLSGRMYYTYDDRVGHVMTDREKERLKKYEAREFTFIKSPHAV
jgi:hypothetical protein